MKFRLFYLLAAGCFGLSFASAQSESSPPPVQLHVESDRPVLPVGDVERASVKISLEGVRLPRPESRSPVNLTIALGTGSMSREKIEQAKAAAIDVQGVVTKNAAEVNRLERQGLDNAARKAYRAENLQTINQQSSYSSR